MATNDSIETEIDMISSRLAVAERLKEYKATLEALLQKTRSALEEYPARKHAELQKRWQEQDRNLKDLLAKLQCSIPDWENRLCHAVAPLFAEIAGLKCELRPTPAAPEPPAGTSEGLYARRERLLLRLAKRQARYEQARLALAAWEKPAPTLEKILNDNDKLVADIKKSIGQPEAPALLYDMFFKLLPMYYLIAPAAAASTRIDAKDFVTRHAGEEAWDDLTEMLGPQPMLIEPAAYLKHLAGAPLKDFNQASTELAETAGDLQKIQDEIKRAEKALEERRKTLEKAARAALLDAPAAPTKQVHQAA